MTDPIDSLREQIDAVDAELLDLIARRLQLSAKVREAKRSGKSGARVWRPSREEALVRDLVEASTRSGEGVSPPLVSRIWAELVSASLALQGPMRLHVGLEGDKLRAWSLVRDRFGAALPTEIYPTTSTALAQAYADPEGVAVVPSPGGMNNWWVALCPGGAMEDMKILTGLPRVRNADWPRDDWPRAVAVAQGEIVPSGADRFLVVTEGEPRGTVRARSGGWTLTDAREVEEGDHLIGILPDPLPHE